jgi:His/Glu/Gln/Arg/opine family amino acid ABC transporter permease subunit
MDLLFNSLPLLARGTATTLYLSAAAIVLATVLGVTFALLQLYGGFILRALVEVYLYVVRGVPLLVLLFAMYYALPYANVQISPVTGGILVIGIYFGAFMTEVFRGAVLSVPKGQWEAARTVGLTTPRILVDVVLAQAARVAGPPFINTCIMVVKGTSLVAIIGLADVTYVGKQIVERTLAPFEIFGAVAVIYFVICFALSRLGRYLERRVNYVN